ncbi:hypothetical protein D9M69_642860 [compost metagenome]
MMQILLDGHGKLRSMRINVMIQWWSHGHERKAAPQRHVVEVDQILLFDQEPDTLLV